MLLVLILSLCGSAAASPMLSGYSSAFDKYDYDYPKSETLWPFASFPSYAASDPLPLFEDFASGFRHMDVDGIAPAKSAKRSLPRFPQFAAALPQMPFDAARQIEQQPGVAPKFTGSFSLGADVLRDIDPETAAGPVSNPAAYFLEGARLDLPPAPKCRLTGCTGPVVNDGSLSPQLVQDSSRASASASPACHTTFVPLNDACLSGKAYPVAMVCEICCECADAFVREMEKSRGFRTGYKDDQH